MPRLSPSSSAACTVALLAASAPAFAQTVTTDISTYERGDTLSATGTRNGYPCIKYEVSLGDETDIATIVDYLVDGVLIHSRTLTKTNASGVGYFDLEAFEADPEPGDLIEVRLRPAPGAPPDPDPTNDSATFVFSGEDTYWNRTVEHILLARGGHGAYELHVELVVEGNYSGTPDLGAEVIATVDGVPYGPFPTSFENIGTWNECADAACDDSVPCVMDPTGPYYGSCQPNPTAPDDCLCRIHYVPMVIPLELAAPPETIVVQLVPVPGALPELPGFEDDDEMTTCRGDIDGDAAVTFTDLVALLAAWGPCAGCPEDLDGNDEVDFADLVMLLSAWGPCFPV